MELNPKEVIKIIRHVAKTEVMPLFRNLRTEDIREKNPGDFVTIADENSEKKFTKLLKELLPDSEIVGEEAVAKDATILELLNQDKPVWLIDPIDGTYNYKTGSENFGILISLVKNKQAIMAFCYDAPKDECFYAVKSKGVYDDAGNRLAEFSKRDITEEISDMHGLVGAEQLDKLESIFKKLTRVRCSLHMTLRLIKDEADFALWHSITPWDNAGCSLLLAELGAKIAYIDNTQYSATDKLSKSKSLLAAKSETNWQKIANIIKKQNS